MSTSSPVDLRPTLLFLVPDHGSSPDFRGTVLSVFRHGPGDALGDGAFVGDPPGDGALPPDDERLVPVHGPAGLAGLPGLVCVRP